MAYVSQDRKKSLAPAIKAVLKKYNVKGTLSVRNHSSLVLTLKSGSIDFIENFINLKKLNASNNKIKYFVFENVKSKKDVYMTYNIEVTGSFVKYPCAAIYMLQKILCPLELLELQWVIAEKFCKMQEDFMTSAW